MSYYDEIATGYDALHKEEQLQKLLLMLDALEVSDADSVLDVGCGAGRVCLHLQEQGHEVIGIDNSPLAVKVARERGVQDARVLSITQASRNKLGQVDTIVMMGNNFGLFASPKRARWLLRRFAKPSAGFDFPPPACAHRGRRVSQPR